MNNERRLIDDTYLTDHMALDQIMGPTYEDASPFCVDCYNGKKLRVPAFFLQLPCAQPGQESYVPPKWRFVCAMHEKDARENLRSLRTFALVVPESLDLDHIYAACPVPDPLPPPAEPAPLPLPDPKPADSCPLHLYGRVLSAAVEGGPLDGYHLVIEPASSGYPWRLPHTEGSKAPQPRTWGLPLERPRKSTPTEAAHAFVDVDFREAGRFLGQAVRITVEFDTLVEV